MSNTDVVSGKPREEETKQETENKKETALEETESGTNLEPGAAVDPAHLTTAAEPTPLADSKQADAGPKEQPSAPESSNIEKNDPPAKDEKLTTAPSASLADGDSNPGAIVTLSNRKRPPFTYDPNKITLRFLFANKDGLTVTIECKPSDTVGEVKGSLLSVWPEALPACKGGDRLRLICMGKGVLMPDTRTLEDCQVPVFRTHATPVNVSVRPDIKTVDSEKHGVGQSGRRSHGSTANTVEQGCACVIL